MTLFHLRIKLSEPKSDPGFPLKDHRGRSTELLSMLRNKVAKL